MCSFVVNVRDHLLFLLSDSQSTEQYCCDSRHRFSLSGLLEKFICHLWKTVFRGVNVEFPGIVSEKKLHDLDCVDWHCQSINLLVSLRTGGDTGHSAVLKVPVELILLLFAWLLTSTKSVRNTTMDS